ncbi:MAG: DUF222 domain-containing protein [Actinomycetes bacterium]
MLPMPVVPPAVAHPRDAVVALARDAGMAPASGARGTAVGAAAHLPGSAEERAAWLVGLRQIVDAAEATFTAVLADFDAAGDGEVLHAAASTQAWLRGALGMAAGDASERVRIARASRDLLQSPFSHLVPGFRQAEEVTESASHADGASSPVREVGIEDSDNRLSFEQIKVIDRAVRSLPPSSHHDAVAALTQIGSHVGVDDLRATARHLKQVIDPDGSLRQAETDFQRRWLTVAPMLDGMHSVEGVLDTESAALLNSALAPFAVPSGADDRRTAAQRRADGLTEIVAAAVKSGELPTLSGSSTALQVQVSLATLVGGEGDPAQLLSSGSTTPLWITGPSLGRFTCDAAVRRIVLDPSGVPVELGRQVRLFSGPQRQALATRDDGCRFPGCDRPARFTDAHHLVPWTAGGPTTLANGLLLCRYHHRQVHEGGWRIQPTHPDVGANGTVRLLGPDGQRLASPLRGSARAGPSP